VHDVLRRRHDLSEYDRLVQELRLDSNRFHGYFRMSTEQFYYVLGLVEPHILRLATVYVAVYVQGRTTSYDAVRRRTYKSAQKSSKTRFLRFTTYRASYDVARSVNAADTLHVFD